MRRMFSLLLAVGLLLGSATQARAQTVVSVTNVQVFYVYGEQVTFSATLQSPVPIQEAYIIFQPIGEPSARIALLSVGADGSAVYQHLISQGVLRPFAPIYFWYRIVLSPGDVYTSPQYYFRYEDNRPPWQTSGDGQIRVHWYAGDAAFGQAAFDAAHRGLQSVAELFPVTLDQPIDVYVYASASDVQETLGLGGESWVAGHASPDLDVVLVSIPPGETQSIEMERQIPHELTHVLLYRQVGTAYFNLPTWLIEGLATEAELYPNADYRYILSVASQNRTLFPLTDLCGPFPADASGALLAYAESGSFVGYIREAHGTSGLQALIDAYADGLNCEQGAYRALGGPLSQIDLRWRQAVLGEDITGVALQNLAPYFIVMALALAIPLWRIRSVARSKEKVKDARPRSRR